MLLIVSIPIHTHPCLLGIQATLKRIHHEIANLKKDDLGEITLKPSDDSLFQWTATIPGPEGSCYEGGIFHADIKLSHDYPYVSSPLYLLPALSNHFVRFSAPTVTFRTRYVPLMTPFLLRFI